MNEVSTVDHDGAAAETVEVAKVLSGSIYFSSEDDVAEVFAFYEDNQHPHVDPIDPEVLERETVDGRVILLRAEGDIALASSAFNFSVNKDEPPSWVEIGGTLSTRDLRGFGFYPLIIASQVMQECLAGEPPQDYLFANIYDDNAKVQDLLGVQTGWENFKVAEDHRLEAAYAAKKNAEPAEMATWAWFRSRPNALPHQAGIVDGFLEERHFMNLRDPDQPIRLDMDVSGFALAQADTPRMIKTMAEGPVAELLREHGSELTCQETMAGLHEDAGQGLIQRFEV